MSGLDGGPGVLERTHGKSLKKIQKSVEKLSNSLSNRSRRDCEELRKDTDGFVLDFSLWFPPPPRTESCPPPRFSFFKAPLTQLTVNRQNNRMTTHFRSGPAFGLSAEVKSKVGLQFLYRPEVYLQNIDTLWREHSQLR